MFRLILGGILMVLVGMQTSPSLASYSLKTGDAEAIKQVINLQLAAFEADDGETAFSYASPGVQEKFRSSDMFLQMVKQHYRPAYRPQSIHFGRLEQTDAGPLQHALILDSTGAALTAVYLMEQQHTGDWRVAGCYLMIHEMRAA